MGKNDKCPIERPCVCPEAASPCEAAHTRLVKPETVINKLENKMVSIIFFFVEIVPIHLREEYVE